MIFVFNRKTAYEMRISDWSSDVCSTDLKINVIVGRPSVAFVELGRNALDDKPALLLGAIDDVFQHVVEETAVGLLVACCAGNTVLAADNCAAIDLEAFPVPTFVGAFVGDDIDKDVFGGSEVDAFGHVVHHVSISIVTGFQPGVSQG